MRLLILAPLLAATALTAQMPDVVIRTTTRLVQINLIATKHGQPVPGLKKEDFRGMILKGVPLHPILLLL